MFVIFNLTKSNWFTKCIKMTTRKKLKTNRKTTKKKIANRNDKKNKKNKKKLLCLYYQFTTSQKGLPLFLIYINRNIFSLTPLFIAAGLPSSNSSPASPPSLSICSSLSRNSSSSSAIVFFFSGFFASEAEGLAGACSCSSSKIYDTSQTSDRMLAWQNLYFFVVAAATAVCGGWWCRM